MMSIYQTGGDRFKSTGVAMVPLNGWLVKIRFTSAELTAVEMAAALPPILETIKWPRNRESGPPAAAVRPCDDQLTLTENVERIKPSMTDALIGGISAVAIDSDDTEEDPRSVVYCRDPQDAGQFSIYRANGSASGYVLQLGDAGRALSI